MRPVNDDDYDTHAPPERIVINIQEGPGGRGGEEHRERQPWRRRLYGNDTVLSRPEVSVKESESVTSELRGTRRAGGAGGLERRRSSSPSL